MPSNEPRRAALPVPLLEGAAVLAFSSLFLHLVMFRNGTFVYLFHKASTGAWIDEGARVLDGEVMYRDFFEFVGPGIVYLNAAVMAVFGDGLDTLAYAGLAVGVAITCLLHSLSASLVASPWRLLPPALFVVLVYPPYDLGSHKWPALLLGLLGLALVVGRAPDFRRSYAAGVAFGLGTLFTLDIGLGFVAGTCVHLLTARRRASLLGLWIGYATPIAPVMGWFGLEAGLSTVLHDWLVFPWTHHAYAFDVDLSGPWGPRSAASLALGLASPLAAALLLRKRGAASGAQDATRWEATRLLAFAGLGLVAATVPRGIDPYALAVHCTPLTVCLARGVELLSRNHGRGLLWVRRGVLAVLALGLLHGSVWFVAWRQFLQPQVRQGFRAGAAWIGSPAPEFEWIESHTRPGEGIFVFPAGGMFYFLTRTRNATSFPYMVEGRNGEEQQRQALAEIEARRPAIGLWLDAQRFPVRAGAPGLDTLYRGIVTSYARELALPNGTILFRRKEALKPP